MELSTSRRLKTELAGAFAAQQRQTARGVGLHAAADMVLSSRAPPLDRQHPASDGGGGDTGAGLAIGAGGQGSRGGAAVGAMMMIMPGLPPGATSRPAGTGRCTG